MIRYGAILAALFAAIAIAGLWPVETQAVINTNHGINQQPPTLMRLLVEMGNAYGRYFTVESAWEDGEPVNKMESTIVEASLMPSPVRSSEDKTRMQATLDTLKQEIPNLTLMQDPSDERIVHVIDSRLSNLEGYGLSYTVKSLEFAGPIGGLLKYMRSQGIPVSRPSFMLLNELGSYDTSTIVQVKGQNSQVRTLLSNCVPLEERGRILWVARTKLAKGAVSEVKFMRTKRR